MQDVDHEEGNQRNRMKLRDEVSIVAGLHVCAVVVSAPPELEDTDISDSSPHGPADSEAHRTTRRRADRRRQVQRAAALGQVKEAREKETRLMTEHVMFDTALESDATEKR